MTLSEIAGVLRVIGIGVSRIFTWRRIGMVAIRKSVADPSVNTQLRPSLWAKYRSLTHCLLFLGCRRLAQFHVMRQIA